jgi:hypothetical protein
MFCDSILHVLVHLSNVVHLPRSSLLDTVLELMDSELPVINDSEQLCPILIVGTGDVLQSLFVVPLLKEPLILHSL